MIAALPCPALPRPGMLACPLACSVPARPSAAPRPLLLWPLWQGHRGFDFSSAHCDRPKDCPSIPDCAEAKANVGQGRSGQVRSIRSLWHPSANPIQSNPIPIVRRPLVRSVEMLKASAGWDGDAVDHATTYAATVRADMRSRALRSVCLRHSTLVSGGHTAHSAQPSPACFSWFSMPITVRHCY